MIQMTGTNHKIAPVQVRSLFSISEEQQRELMEQLMKIPEVEGAVVLSTCNRTEVWISTNSKKELPLTEMFLNFQQAEEEKYREYFFERSEDRAVQHLFYMTSGLRSAILAEDQILAQVKDALEYSRACGYTDHTLEILFRMAVAAAKEVKTKVRFTHVNHTAVDQALNMLEESGFSLEGKNCLVIGNGKYGKLAATKLKEKKANVKVTVRFYDRGSNTVTVPEGCEMVNFTERMTHIAESDLIISATSSPHYTIKLEDVKKLSMPLMLGRKPILIDLAVPRDVDPQIEKRHIFECYNIDDFESSEEELNTDAYEKAKAILEKQIHEFYSRLQAMELVPHIQQIRSSAAMDVELRLDKILHHLPLPKEEQEDLVCQVSAAAEKAVNRMLFDLKKYVSEEAYLEVISGLEKVYEEK